MAKGPGRAELGRVVESRGSPPVGTRPVGVEVTDADLEHLEGLGERRDLDLSLTRVTDAGLARLEGSSRLERLDLFGTRVSDAGLRHLRGLSGLRALYLESTAVTDAGLAELKALPGLEVLVLDRPEAPAGPEARGLAHSDVAGPALPPRPPVRST